MRFAWILLFVIAAPAATAATGDEDFLAAREAFRTGKAAQLDRLAPRLKDHLLEPYVDYWRLSMKLDRAAPEEVRAFLAANADTPLSEQLRGRWLKALGKRGEWERFDQELPALVRDDVELTCYSLQSRLRVNESEALPEARPLWFVARDMPDSCSPLFEALFEAGMLSRDDLWTRIRLALETGQVTLARGIARWLPAGEAPDARAMRRIASNPGGYLDRPAHFNLKTRAGREMVIFAVHRLARTAAPHAAERWLKLEERFSPGDRAYVWGMIGQFAAIRHDPGALEWYARAAGLSDLQLAWKARAALRALDWENLLSAINAMTKRESSEPTWRYWKARALIALGRPGEAEALLKPLATDFGFYGQLALEALGGHVAAPATGYKPGAEELSEMEQDTGLRRALELYRLGLRIEATREWLWAIRNFDDKQLLAASEVARRNNIYDRAIGTADRTVALHDFELRYLAPYREVLKPQTEQLALDEAWVYGLIRQESRFIANARSGSGAGGLMQIMPGTARWVARQLGLRNWRWSRVTDIDTNVSLGTYYLRHVLDTLDGQPVLASAAYNAGPGRARAWRPDESMEGAIFAETIPFRETRHYVKKVMANASYYALNFSHQPQLLSQRLGVIGPRDREHEIPLGDTP